MPDWRRIQVTNFDRRSEVTNCRSSSDRCAVVTIAQRGVPSDVYSIDWMSRAGPSAHAANAGDASNPLSRMASFMRSSGGKNWSSSNTPNFRIGGFPTRPTRVGRSSARPSVHEWLIKLESKMCSRLDSGSAAMPTNPSRPETYPSISSPTTSASPMSSGTCSEPTMFTGTPDFDPGV